jgi:ADP-ribosylglycohydrolase
MVEELGKLLGLSLGDALGEAEVALKSETSLG